MRRIVIEWKLVCGRFLRKQ